MVIEQRGLQFYRAPEERNCHRETWANISSNSGGATFTRPFGSSITITMMMFCLAPFGPLPDGRGSDPV